ncbi:MAG: hypothetical protein U0T65_01390 [Buchnera aphidicola (Nurudea yanoniella)]
MQVINRRLKNVRYKKHKRKIHQRFRNNIFEREIKKIFFNTQYLLNKIKSVFM